MYKYILFSYYLLSAFLHSICLAFIWTKIKRYCRQFIFFFFLSLWRKKPHMNRYDSAWFFFYILLVTAYLKHQLKKCFFSLLLLWFFLLTKAVNSSITNWIGDILAVVFLFLYFLSINEARIIFLLCWVLRAYEYMWVSVCVCVCVCPSQLTQCEFVHYLVVLISWMGTEKKCNALSW